MGRPRAESKGGDESTAAYGQGRHLEGGISWRRRQMAATPRPVPMHAEMERQQREEEKPAEAPDAQLARRPAGELADSAA